MKDQLLGKCSLCKKPLYQDQDGYIFPTTSSSGDWFFAIMPWEYEPRWWHKCNPNDPEKTGTLIEEKLP